MVKIDALMMRYGVILWLLLRISSLIFLFYLFYLIGFIVWKKPLNYAVWHDFFSTITTKIFTLIAVIAVLIHAFIGLWQVMTDYLKRPIQRVLGDLIVGLVSLSYFFYTLTIVLG